MAEAIAAPVAEETEGKKKRFPLKLVLIVLVVVGALAAGYVFVLAPGGDEEEGAVEEPPAPTYSEEAGDPIVVDAGTTSSVGGERRYAMLTYSIRPAIDADPDAVQREFPRMRSEVARLLMSFEADRLLTPKGVGRLESAISDVADEVWPHGEVVEVYLENIVVQ